MEHSKQMAIVVGAGPSGIAAAACLTTLSIPYTILEREDCLASLWNKKTYDRLHLHLAKEACQLPHMPFPSNFPTYVPKKDFIQYLEDYASHFNINPVYNTSVESAVYDEGTKKWKVKARNVGSGEIEEYFGRFLIVATGETSDPFVPEVEGLRSFNGEVIHSTRYKNGERFRNNKVLVVGCGNSGMEIALDLSNFGANTSIVVRSPIHILSRGMVHWGVALAKYVPFKWVEWLTVMMSKLWYGDLTKYGIKRPKDGPFTLKQKYGKFPVIDVGTCKKIKTREIQVLPAITRIIGSDVVFENGKSHPFDTIIFATGFKRSTNKWLMGDTYLLNEQGFPKPSFPNHWKGENGLYCVGLASKGLYGAGMEAQNIANHIKTLL